MHIAYRHIAHVDVDHTVQLFNVDTIKPKSHRDGRLEGQSVLLFSVAAEETIPRIEAYKADHNSFALDQGMMAPAT